MLACLQRDQCIVRGTVFTAKLWLGSGRNMCTIMITSGHKRYYHISEGTRVSWFSTNSMRAQENTFFLMRKGVKTELSYTQEEYLDNKFLNLDKS